MCVTKATLHSLQTSIRQRGQDQGRNCGCSIFPTKCRQALKESLQQTRHKAMAALTRRGQASFLSILATCLSHECWPWQQASGLLGESREFSGFYTTCKTMLVHVQAPQRKPGQAQLRKWDGEGGERRGTCLAQHQVRNHPSPPRTRLHGWCQRHAKQAACSIHPAAGMAG